ncbi:ADP-ribosyltransferase [Nocardia sp. NPDC006044]|uniref:ADP-ribosyltransferase n=1 Tax=Nocardia sp. NPDC006044 TaxID=3364306 RepID=UPI0036B7D1A7
MEFRKLARSIEYIIDGYIRRSRNFTTGYARHIRASATKVEQIDSYSPVQFLDRSMFSDFASSPRGSIGRIHRRFDSKPGWKKNGIRHFDSNREGEEYGDRYLSETFRRLPPECRREVLRYTDFANPYNLILRPRGLMDSTVMENSLRALYFNVDNGLELFHLVDGTTPGLSDLFKALNRTDINRTQRDLIRRIDSSPTPRWELQKILRLNSGMRGCFMAAFDGWPRWSDVEQRILLLDRALDHPLPEGLRIHRNLVDPIFMMDGNSPFELVGTEWHEPSYISGSLGKTPIQQPGLKHGICSTQLHLDAPEGTPGLYIGRESTHSDQREILLQRGLSYTFTSVRREGRIWHLYATIES